ncbi:MAG: hypothetical protein KAI86_15790, partial [Desulfobacterales bacterium]|nr:hypothetical protein [Desulfobacterales bacterium]
SGDGCSATCVTEDTEPYCGDGIVNQPSEECDDGLSGSDTCTPECTLIKSSISGCKYNDVNNNGVIDTGEEKMSGWKIQLIGCPYLSGGDLSFPSKDGIGSGLPGSCVVMETTSTVDGCYTFDNLDAGDYGISEVAKDNWTQTYPAYDTFYYFPLGAGENKTNIDFANFTEYQESYCGDGNLDPDEQCDDGENNGNSVYCSRQCAINPECDNGIDDDGDGQIDYPNDPGCDSLEDDDEYNVFCGDGVCNGDETCSTCPRDCGSCGGGGGGAVITKPSITITNENVVYLGGGEAQVSWTTNIETTRQVVYGDDSISSLVDAPKYGYDSVSGESLDMTKEHNVTIDGLTDGIVYYFRPVADRSGSTGEKVGIEVFYELGEVKGVSDSPAPVPTPIPVECNYLLEYIKLGADNNPIEVEKLERFLNEFENENLAVNGVYEQVDFDAVSRFQEKYLNEVLSPWNHDSSTGYVYITTKKRINEIYCQREFPLTSNQANEVASFSSRFLSSSSEPSEEIQDQDDQQPSQLPEDEEEQEEDGKVKGDKDEEPGELS